MSDLSSLKVGDEVLFRYMGNKYHKGFVEGITPSGQIKVAGLKFRSNGRQIGGSTGYKSYIYPFDQATLDKQYAKESEAKMRIDCRDAQWHNMDVSLVAKIHAMLPK